MKGEAAIKRLGLLAGALVLLTACGGGTASTVNAAAAKSAADVGGMSALIAAAKKEGKLNIIATPPDWANYGAIIDGFKAKYGISIDSANPNGSSQDEINAVKQLGKTSRAPDVLDMGKAVTLANTELYAPYKVQTWNDIPDSQKESTGLYVQDYGGYMSIGYDSAKVPAVTSLQDLLGTGFRGKVALNGDPTKANAALNGVMMASLANGGSADDISKGVDFFHQLKLNGNFTPVQATTATDSMSVRARRREEFAAAFAATRSPRESARFTRAVRVRDRQRVGPYRRSRRARRGPRARWRLI